MLEFMRAGGVGMLGVLLFAVISVIAAVDFFRGPDPRRLQVVRGLTLASIFAILTAVSSNFAAVLSKVPEHPEWSKSPDMPLIVMSGFAEALTPAMLGFALLSVTWFVVGVGLRRAHAEPSADL